METKLCLREEEQTEKSRKEEKIWLVASLEADWSRLLRVPTSL